ncbi:hypothetical protein [Mesorhizobium sp. WSM2239]|uniref:Uncharacterized protein n=2 Tax=unclassified Mesorhizobium TaxID=325217 RepID=A0AAU8D6W8_9HYPH
MNASPPWPDYLPNPVKIDSGMATWRHPFPALNLEARHERSMAHRRGRLAYHDPRGSHRLCQVLQGYSPGP